jgi:hypothetical protein
MKENLEKCADLHKEKDHRERTMESPAWKANEMMI